MEEKKQKKQKEWDFLLRQPRHFGRKWCWKLEFSLGKQS